jgi:hypothetical protein
MDRITSVRSALASGPLSSKDLLQRLGVSRPTLARTLSAMAGEIVTWGAARATHYALRDERRGIADFPVYRVSPNGQLNGLGLLVPIRPQGFVMHQSDGVTIHHEGLPWWMSDMRPQGFLGRAYARQHAATLGLPPDVRHWSDTDALRSLLAHGSDAPGNLLLGDFARDRFVNAPEPHPVKSIDFSRIAQQVLATGDTWSSAGGEQPKFCTTTAEGPVLVKFSVAGDNPTTQRWRDLLLAEHLALETLREGGVPAAASHIVDTNAQRFLVLQRFDRVGRHGRRALLSLAALDGAFVGKAMAPWPVITAHLSQQRLITQDAHATTLLLYAFGTLIGNTDMHTGNLSVMGDEGPPYSISPAYDMLPMAFSPGAGGGVRNTCPAAYLHPCVSGTAWRQAQALAQAYVQRLMHEIRFSSDFKPCLDALRNHVNTACEKIARIL